MAEFVEVEANKRSRESRGLVQGVGVNDSWYMVAKRVKGKRVRCPYYIRWEGVLERGYSHIFKDAYPTYRDVTVCKEWHTFSVFRGWMEQQDWVGKHLDKDIIKPGNKEYGPDTCCFVTGAHNNLLVDSAGRRGEYPKGVSLIRHTGRFKATHSSAEGSKYIGTYDTAEEASEAYRGVKSEIVRKAAQEYACPRVKAGLLSHARLILGGIND